MIKLKTNQENQTNMSNEDTLKRYLLKSFIGLIIYFAIANISIYFQYGAFTAGDLLVNPVYNLIIKPSIGAWIIFLICQGIGWIFFEPRG